MTREKPLVVYVDVDDTLMRHVGTKRLPIPGVVDHVRRLYEAGAELYCWSTGGGTYARSSAAELGIEHCFRAFLPKPQVMIDDQAVSDWRDLVQIQPLSCAQKSIDDYRIALGG